MDISALFQAPVATILVLGGIVIIFFTFFEISKGSVKQKKPLLPKNYLMPVVIGGILILGGLFYRLPTNVEGEESPTPEAITMGFEASSDTATSVPTDTPTSTPTETVTPTATATETATPTTIPVRTFDDGCIAVQTWQARSIDANALKAVSDENYCWNLDNLGIVAESGGTLHILTTPAKVQTASGIYTAISNQSVIEFNIFVNKFYIVYDDKPGFIGFSIAPQDDPMATRGSGRFKLQVKESKNPLVLFVLADTIEGNGTELGTQHYLEGRNYKVRMELKGISMDIYINDVKLKETLSIPSGPKVFYIGYNLPILAKADVEISDIKIDGGKK